jgi:hypothetical protein
MTECAGDFSKAGFDGLAPKNLSQKDVFVAGFTAAVSNQFLVSVRVSMRMLTKTSG